MRSLHEELINILDEKKLSPYFQPIVSLSLKRIIGYEALIRGPSNSPLHSAVNLFNTAERFNLISKLEQLCQELTLQRYASLHLTEKLFININASALLQSQFENSITQKLIDKYEIGAGIIVMELTEHQLTEHYELIQDAVMYYRNRGFEIALNDLGADYCNSKLWSELLPDYVKIDKHFIHGIDIDPVKFDFIQSIQKLASSHDCKLIAEGIETEEEFKTIAKTGISYAQGYYFAKPAIVPLDKIDSSLFVTDSSFFESDQFYYTKPISDIAKIITPVSPETAIGEVLMRFQQNNSMTVLPLVKDGVATGIIFRDLFFAKLFSDTNGLELYSKQPIKIFIDKTPLAIDQNISILSASKKLTSTRSADAAFLILRNGEYAGIVTLLDLLQEITHQQIDSSKYTNPLTLLPGSVPINKRIDRLLEKKSSFCVAYFDLDNFKPFNDIYGHQAGDEVIKAVAKILKRQVPGKKAQTGHLGEDCFIAIFGCDDWLSICKAILRAFKKIVPDHYKEKDIKAGGIHAENRLGQECFYPLMSMSIGIVDQESTSQCKSHIEIADLAAGAIIQSKNTAGNSLFVNKRTGKKSGTTAKTNTGK